MKKGPLQTSPRKLFPGQKNPVPGVPDTGFLLLRNAYFGIHLHLFLFAEGAERILSFRPPFSKGGAGVGRGGPRKRHFFFAKLFSLCLRLQRKKRQTKSSLAFNKLFRLRNTELISFHGRRGAQTHAPCSRPKTVRMRLDLRLFPAPYTPTPGQYPRQETAGIPQRNGPFQIRQKHIF